MRTHMKNLTNKGRTNLIQVTGALLQEGIMYPLLNYWGGILEEGVFICSKSLFAEIIRGCFFEKGININFTCCDFGSL